MLDKEYSYYQDNKDTLLSKYRDKFIVIKGEEVIGSYDSKEQAFTETLKTEKLGTFLVQQCVEDDTVLRFTSRVSFA